MVGMKPTASAPTIQIVSLEMPDVATPTPTMTAVEVTLLCECTQGCSAQQRCDRTRPSYQRFHDK
jgi:hypothetical protein